MGELAGLKVATKEFMFICFLLPGGGFFTPEYLAMCLLPPTKVFECVKGDTNVVGFEGSADTWPGIWAHLDEVSAPFFSPLEIGKKQLHHSV